MNVTSAQVDLQRGVPPKAKFTAVIIESRAAECFTANRLAKLGPITSTVNNECAALSVRLKTTVDVFMSFLFAWCSSVCLQYMENSTYMYMYHHAYLHSNCFENTPVRIPSIHVYIKIII